MENNNRKNRNQNNTISHYRIKNFKTNKNMVTAKTLREYEFKTIQEYYEYILLSIINGQRQQALNLIKLMSRKQKKQAVEHLEIYVSNQADECRKLILTTL